MARKLVLAMQEAIVALSNRTDGSAVPYEPAQLHLDTYFKINTAKKMQVEYVIGNEEPLEFVHYFADWFVCSDVKEKVQKRCAIFDPDMIDDNDSKDAERDLEGRLLSESANRKVKYSETAEYRRNSLIQQEKRNRRASSSESFTSVELRSTSPPADLVSRSECDTPDSAAADTISPLTTLGMTQSSRRSSTGSLFRSARKDNGGVDHFLQVKLKSTAASVSVYDTNHVQSTATDAHTVPPTPVLSSCSSVNLPSDLGLTSPAELPNPLIREPNSPVKNMSLTPNLLQKTFSSGKHRCTPPPSDSVIRLEGATPASATTSTINNTTNPGMTSFNRRGSTGSPHSGRKDNAGADHFQQVKLKSTAVSGSVYETNNIQSTTPETASPTPVVSSCNIPCKDVLPSGAPVATTCEDPRDTAIIEEIPLSCDPRSVITPGEGLDLISKRGSQPIDTRRASTGSYSPPKSFVPSSAAKEDFRQVKLRSSQRSIYQTAETDDTTHQDKLKKNDMPKSETGREIVPSRSSVEAEKQSPPAAEVKDNSSVQPIDYSSTAEDDATEKIDVPPAGCCVIM